VSLRTLLNQPLTVQGVGGSATDEYGNEVLAPAGSAIPEVGYLEQRDSTEYLDGRQTVVSRWVAYLLPESSVVATSYITFGGQTFQVDGEPWHVFNPRTRAVDHIECKLTVVS
jgi:hypothetical protein